MLILLALACAHHAATDAASEAVPATPAPLPSWAGTSCGTTVPDVVATIDGEPVHKEELAAFDPQDLIAAEAGASSARAQALDGLIVRRLVEKQAAAESMEPDAWIDREIGARSKPVTDEDVQAFYRDHFDQMEGAALSEVQDQIRQHLEEQAAQDAAGDIIRQVEAGAKIERFLEPYRVLVDAGDGPRLGPADAPVQIVEFSDFQCPYCARASKTVHALADRYGDQVSIVFRNFPLPFHDHAHRAAEAAVCAREQGGFWKYHDALFADQKAWTDDDFRGYAKRAGLDPATFDDCLASDRAKAVVDADLAAGDRVGMNGTPGFYVNGIVLSGAQPEEAFAEVIDQELARR